MNYNEKYQYLEKIYEKQIMSINDNFPYVLTISLTDKCNLNCTNCQAFCDINQKNNNFITLKDLQYSIPLIKDVLPNCLNITLFGGEPLLNPELKDICHFLRLQFPKAYIQIFSNGILLQEWKDEDYLELKDMNINFLFTLYPLKNMINNLKNQELKLKKYNINFEIHGIRPYFCKTSYNKEGLNNPNEKFFQCCHSAFPPNFYLDKNKLFKCGIEPGFEKIGLPVSESDYLLVSELTYEKIKKLCSKPLDACKYCGFSEEYGSDEIFPWHQQSKLPSEYFFSLKDLYVNNYELYYKYLHTNHEEIKEALRDEYFLSKYQAETYTSDPMDIFFKRFFSGAGDIFIPFDKNILEDIVFFFQFKEILLKQTDFLNLNFYFVNFDKNKDAKNFMYRSFLPTSCDIKGNFYFLESNNFNESKEVFLKNSYLQNKFILYINKDNYYSLKNDKEYLIKNLRSINEIF